MSRMPWVGLVLEIHQECGSEDQMRQLANVLWELAAQKITTPKHGSQGRILEKYKLRRFIDGPIAIGR